MSELEYDRMCRAVLAAESLVNAAQAAVGKLETENARLLACAMRDEDEINNGDARIAELEARVAEAIADEPRDAAMLEACETELRIVKESRDAAGTRIVELARKIDAARSFINRHYDMDLSAAECIECIRKVLT